MRSLHVKRERGYAYTPVHPVSSNTTHRRIMQVSCIEFVERHQTRCDRYWYNPYGDNKTTLPPEFRNFLIPHFGHYFPTRFTTKNIPYALVISDLIRWFAEWHLPYKLMNFYAKLNYVGNRFIRSTSQDKSFVGVGLCGSICRRMGQRNEKQPICLTTEW